METNEELRNLSLNVTKSNGSNDSYRNPFAHYVLYLKLNPDKVDEMLNEFVYVMREFTQQLERESKIEELFQCYAVVNEIVPNSEVILNNIGAQLFRWVLITSQPPIQLPVPGGRGEVNEHVIAENEF